MSMKHYDIMLRYKLFVTARVLLFISALPNEADGDVVKAACNIEIRSVMEWMDGVSVSETHHRTRPYHHGTGWNDW